MDQIVYEISNTKVFTLRKYYDLINKYGETCGYQRPAVEIPATGKPTEPENPEKPEKPENPEKPGKPDVPKTGDSGNVLLWLSALTVSAGALAAMLSFRRKKREE